jgi:hypothetical protein
MAIQEEAAPWYVSATLDHVSCKQAGSFSHADITVIKTKNLHCGRLQRNTGGQYDIEACVKLNFRDL